MAGPKKKAVVSTTDPEQLEHQVRFQPQRFDALVFDKGYEVYIDKAIRCPCSVKGNGQPLPSCDNCIGIGWVFIDRTSTRIAIQSINADVKYENWTKLSTGLAKVTARAVDRLAFMDRILIREAEGYYNEIVRVREMGSKKVCFTTYEILEVESVFFFESDKKPLRRLKIDEYTVENERIVLNDRFNSMENVTLSIRYKHLMTYHIIDMNRDIMKVRTKEGCSATEEEMQNMPVSGTARKAQFLFDNLKFEQAERLIEN